jgi:hypothetical protein
MDLAATRTRKVIHIDPARGTGISTRHDGPAPGERSLGRRGGSRTRTRMGGRARAAPPRNHPSGAPRTPHRRQVPRHRGVEGDLSQARPTECPSADQADRQGVVVYQAEPPLYQRGRHRGLAPARPPREAHHARVARDAAGVQDRGPAQLQDAWDQPAGHEPGDDSMGALEHRRDPAVPRDRESPTPAGGKEPAVGRPIGERGEPRVSHPGRQVPAAPIDPGVGNGGCPAA